MIWQLWFIYVLLWQEYNVFQLDIHVSLQTFEKIMNRLTYAIRGLRGYVLYCCTFFAQVNVNTGAMKLL